MTEKHNTSVKISEENIPAILRVHGEGEDPNLQDVPRRDLPKYLREQYWIKQWGPINRWKFSLGGGLTRQLHLADLNRKLDDPGDAFFELYLGTLRSCVNLRFWVEVTEVFSPQHASMVNRFIREYNGLRGKGKIDPTEFLNSLKLGLPTPYLQREMADKVIEAIEKKAKKGHEEGSYKSLVRDYGRGQLIVGLPLWFATFPSDPMDPSMALKDFCIRLNLGLEQIKYSVLRANWCPFDSVVILWNPSLESIDEWSKVANPGFYSDPANHSLNSPFSLIKGYSYLKERDLLKLGSTSMNVSWDRYSSLDAMLDKQLRQFRFFTKHRPLGPKACLEVHESEGVVTSLRMGFYIWLCKLWLFARMNGWYGLRRWIGTQLSVRRLYFILRLIYQARKLYRSSSSNCSKGDVNDSAG